MNKTLLSVLLLACSSFLFSCKKDDNTKTDNNYICINENYCDLTSGYVSSDYDEGGYYDSEIILTGPSISWNSKEEEFRGSDVWIYFYVYSKSSTIAPGTYVVNGSGTIPGTTYYEYEGLNEIEAEFGYNGNPDESDEIDFISGKVTVSKDGKIDFELTSEQADMVKGSFSGDLKKIDW